MEGLLRHPVVTVPLKLLPLLRRLRPLAVMALPRLLRRLRHLAVMALPRLLPLLRRLRHLAVMALHRLLLLLRHPLVECRSLIRTGSMTSGMMMGSSRSKV